MKHFTAAITAFLFFYLSIASCKLQPSEYQGTSPSSAVPARPPSNAVPFDSAKYDSLLSLLIKLENAVYANTRSQSNASLGDLKKVSFDSADGCFLVAGKGAYNKSQPEAVQAQGRAMAASADGKRWALYLKAWHDGGSLAFGQKISGEVTYSKILLEQPRGDTLYQLIQIPFGSLVLK
ncbi:MAG TPA: hypothetical protein VLX68_06775 [Chitinivibrionales bacterium]|nr:hypothetical protein [Chitinivibrionales bacterium]